MSGVEESRDRLKAERAFEMYDALGDDRSLNKLWKQCVALNRQGIEVPTTTRPKIYAWAEQHDWADRLARREALRNDATRASLAQVRERGYDNVALILDAAVTELGKLVTNADSDRVRLEAIRMVLDRTGVIDLSKGRAAQALADQQSESGGAPDPDTATDADLIRFLNEKSRQ